MTNPVGGEAVLLQPSLLQGTEPRRGADPGARPDEGFAMMLAGLLAASQVAPPLPASTAAPAPAAGAAPPPAPSGRTGALPWDALAAAAEEAGRLAAAFQMPQGALAVAIPEEPEATLPAAPAPASPPTLLALPGGMPKMVDPGVAIPDPTTPPASLASAAPSQPAAQPLGIIPGGALDASPQQPLPEARSERPAIAQPPSPAPLPAGPAEAVAKAGNPLPATTQIPPSVPPASLPVQAMPQAAAVPSPDATPRPPTDAMPAAEPVTSRLPRPTELATPALSILPEETQALAAIPPQPQLRPGTPAMATPALSEGPSGASKEVATPPWAAPVLLPTAITTAAPPGEVALHSPAHPGAAVPVSETTTAEPGSTPLPGPAPALVEALPEPEPLLLSVGQGQAVGTSPAVPPPAAMPAQAPLPQNRLAAEAAPQLVLRMAQAARKDGVETISVDLRPPELGRVELQLTFRDGAVQVVMRAEQAETFDALRHERHNLVQQMEQAGLQLGGSGLDLQHGPLPHPKPSPEEAFASARPAAAEPEPDAEAQAGAAAPRRAASDSLIDILT